MIVHEIRLENIKSYGTPPEVIKLTRGVNAISGPNGAGKSTILEAIGTALFQHLPYRHEDFVREGESSGTMTVVVESRFDQRAYEVVRRVGKGSAHYVFDPDIAQQVARGESEMGRWLRRHLQVEEEVDLKALFVDTIGPPQGTLTAAFLDSPQARRLKFNRLLRVDEYEDAFRKLSPLETAIDAERRDLDVRIARIEVETRVRPELESRRAETRDAQAALGMRLDCYVTERDEVDRLLVAFEAAQSSLREAEAALSLALEREEYASERLRRARADQQAALAAQEACIRNESTRATYLEAEEHLRALESKRHELSLLERERNDLTVALKEAQGELALAVEGVTRGEQALAQIAALERLIPSQEAAEARLHAAREAMRLVEESRKAMVVIERRLERATARVARADSALARVEALRAIAASLPDCQARHEEIRSRLDASHRAVGEVQAVQRSVAEHERQANVLRQDVASIDGQIAEATRLAEPELVVASIEGKHRQVAENRAAAQSHLSHATKTRIQVAGGLCPFLHEECNNLRPGVTLETHFDGEIIHWRGEIERLDLDYAVLDRQLGKARAAEQHRAQVTQLRDRRERAAGGLVEADSRVSAGQRKLREISALANAQAQVERDEKAALATVREAEQAAQEIARSDLIRAELREAGEEQERVAAERRDAQERISQTAAAEAELRSAVAAANEIGHPRESVGRYRDEAEKLPGYRARRQRSDLALSAAKAKLADVDERLRPYAEVDATIERRRAQREASRHGYEAYLAASPVARELPTRAEALRQAENKSESAATETRGARATADSAKQAYDAVAHRANQERRAELNTAIGKTQAERRAAAEDEERINLQLETVRRRELELAALRREADSVESDRQVGSALRQAIRAAGPEITRQLLTRISRVATRINADILNQAGVELEWTTDYEIVTRRQGETRGFAQLSGGEQMAAALAVRLGAMRLLSNLRFAFLDEPTAHLDQARRANLGDQVQRLQGFDQLVVISHDDTFDGLFGHVVRIGTEGGRSRVIDQG